MRKKSPNTFLLITPYLALLLLDVWFGANCLHIVDGHVCRFFCPSANDLPELAKVILPSLQLGVSGTDMFVEGPKALVTIVFGEGLTRKLHYFVKDVLG